jgi:PAS domain S-box-containing protein
MVALSSVDSSAAPVADELIEKPEENNVNLLTKGVWLRSITGLLLIAILATATFFILHDVLSINQSSGAIVNISGRQRMLSQRGAFFAARLVASTDTAERASLRSDLEKVADLMLKSHDGLTHGSTAMGLPEHMSDAMRALYFDAPQQLDLQVRQYVGHIRQLLQDVDQGRADTGSAPLQAITTAASTRLLTTLNMAVVQYEKEATDEVQRAIRYEAIVYGVTLLSLLLEAALIYRPLVNRVKNTTQNLVRQQQFSDRVVNTSQALIIGLGSGGEVTLFNQHSERLSGYRQAEVMGKDFGATFLPPTSDPAEAQTLARLFSGQSDQRVETPLLTKDGRTLTIEWSNTQLIDPVSQQPLLLLATGVDITLRKQAEQELQMALDKTAALSSRLRQEVEHAAILQRAMLPSPDISLPGVQGLAHLTTSTEVGGDYYDYYAVDGHHSVFFIGDVSGHGVASGTLVSAAKMAVHQLANQGETDPAAMLEHLNEALLTSSHDSMFMTMLCFSLDSRSGRLRVANAGHSFPYFWMSGEQAWGMIEVEGVPLGRVAEPKYVPVTFDMVPGDRLFLYTDGLIEQENAASDPFGYERVEELLFHVAGQPLDAARDLVFTTLTQHTGSPDFGDDVTVMFLEHTERVSRGGAVPVKRLDKREIVQFDALTFLDMPELPDHVSRQHVVVTHDTGQIGGLLLPICQAGVRRVLPSEQLFLRELGWQELLQQHHRPAGDDLPQWISAPTLQHEWTLAHSDDKARTMQELGSLLGSLGNVPPEMHDILLLMADELIENSLYGAPLDPWQHKIYQKGQRRVVEPAEGIRVLLMTDGERLGMTVIDRWGTFTPATFLNRLALNANHDGIEAGVGGAGMYLMWRMSDYLQIRVKPQQEAQITLLWSLRDLPDPERDSGFQFLFHHELSELLPGADASTAAAASSGDLSQTT